MTELTEKQLYFAAGLGRRGADKLVSELQEIYRRSYRLSFAR